MTVRQIEHLAHVDCAAVACGYNHSVVLSKRGGIYTFGNSEYGQQGNVAKHGRDYSHSSRHFFLPRKLHRNRKRKIVDIQCCENSTILLLQDGGIEGFGWNSHMVMGNRFAASSFVSLSELQDVQFQAISCGQNFILGLAKDSNGCSAFERLWNGDLSDTVIQCTEKTRFHVHKCVMEARAPTFLSACNGSGEILHAPAWASASQIKMFLEWAYTDRVLHLNSHNLRKLLEFSNSCRVYSLQHYLIGKRVRIQAFHEENVAAGQGGSLIAGDRGTLLQQIRTSKVLKKAGKARKKKQGQRQRASRLLESMLKKKAHHMGTASSSNTSASASAKSEQSPPQRVESVEYVSTFSRDMLKLLSSACTTSDVELTVSGQSFHVHKSILSCRSQFFRCLLQGNFAEAQADSIKLHTEISKASFSTILQYMYTGGDYSIVMEKMDKLDLLELLVGACEFQVEDMRQFLEDILASYVRDEDVEELLQHARSLGANLLEARLVDKLKKKRPH